MCKALEIQDWDKRNILNCDFNVKNMAVKADPSETPVSCAKHLNDFRGVICSRASVYQNFSSVSTILFDCFFMSHTEPVAHQFFTSLDTYDFLGTGKSVYLRRNLRIHFL
jgi:hypothetical protein